MEFFLNIAVGAIIIKNVVVFSLCAIGFFYVVSKVRYAVSYF